jgi:PAS domain S-box-containing protein
MRKYISIGSTKTTELQSFEPQIPDDAVIRKLDLYRNAINLHSIVSQTDVKGNITYVNDRFCQISGYTRQELIGNNHRIVKSGFHEKTEFAQLYKQTAQKGSWQGTICNKAKNGELYWVETTVISIKDDTGKVTGYFSIRTDVTNEHNKSIDLDQKNRQFDTAIQNMSQGLCLFSGDKKMIVCNEKFKSIYHLPLNLTAPGAAFIDIINHRFATGGSKSKAEQEIFNYELQRVEKKEQWRIVDQLEDGRHIEIDFCPMHGGGWLATHTDITNTITKERNLAKAITEAQAATNAKSEFLATMSHEIRTPMNGVLGMTDILLESGLDAKQKMLAQTIASSGESLLSIINDILDFSKIEAGKMELDVSSFDLERTVSDIIHMLTPKATKRGVKLVMDYAPELSKYFAGDHGRVRQILTNLIGNAEKFTQSGQVLVTVRGHANKDEMNLQIAVKDTGIGIEPDKLDQIFYAFSQVDGTNTRNFGGTGLGLTIATQMAELMGGKIDAQSTLGTGSVFTFHVTLPIATPAPSIPKPPMQQDQTANAKINILVVDDNKTNQMVVKMMLKDNNLRLTFANNGIEAVEKFKTLQPDITLMDISMPIMGGIDASKNIRQYEHKTNQGSRPIIALTANAVTGDREKYMAAGMNDYLSKPVNKQALREMVFSWAHGNR